MLTAHHLEKKTPIFGEEIVISVSDNECFKMNIEDIANILGFLLNKVKQQALHNGEQIKNSIVFQMQELAANGVHISEEQYGILLSFSKSRRSLVEDYEGASDLFTGYVRDDNQKFVMYLNRYINWLFLTEFYFNSTWYESPVPAER